MALDLPFPAICPFLALSRPCHALPFPSSEVAAADRYGATVRFFTVGMGTTCGSDAAKGQTDCSRPFRELNSVVKVPPWQCPISAPAPPQGAPGSSGWPGAPRGETGPLGAQPLPRVLELAASKAAHFTAFDHVIGSTRTSRRTPTAPAEAATHAVKPGSPRARRRWAQRHGAPSPRCAG